MNATRLPYGRPLISMPWHIKGQNSPRKVLRLLVCPPTKTTRLSLTKQSRQPILPRRVSTIDPQVTAGHEAAGVAEEEDGGAAVLPGHAQPLEHVVVGPDLPALGEALKELLGHGGDDVARREGVDADAAGAPFHGEVLCELDDGGFRGVVEPREQKPQGY